MTCILQRYAVQYEMKLSVNLHQVTLHHSRRAPRLPFCSVRLNRNLTISSDQQNDEMLPFS